MSKIMMNEFENKYMKEVKKYLPLKTNNRKNILSLIQKGMQDYVHDHQITDYDSLITGFGAPQEIADSYIDESPSKTQLQKIRFVILTLIVSILLICSISSGIAYYYYINTPAYIIEEAPVELETFPDK